MQVSSRICELIRVTTRLYDSRVGRGKMVRRHCQGKGEARTVQRKAAAIALS